MVSWYGTCKHRKFAGMGYDVTILMITQYNKVGNHHKSCGIDLVDDTYSTQ